jgi:hypothetical protein
MNKLLALFLTISSLTLATGCDRQSTIKNEHENARTETSDSPQPNVSADLDAHREKGPLLTQWQNQLKVSALETDLRKLSTSDRNSLYTLSKNVLSMVRSLPHKDEIRQSFLSTFTKAVLGGCREDLTGCRYLRLFKQNETTVPLLLEYVKSENPELAERYRLLRLAHTFLNEKENRELTLAYLLTAVEYEKSLGEPTTPAQRLRLATHKELVDQLLLDFVSPTRGLIVERSVLDDLARSFDIWNFERTRSQENSLREKVILQLVGQRLFEGDALNKAIAGFEKDPRALRTKLQPTTLARPKIIESLGLHTEVPKTISTFLFEGLWLQKLTKEEAKIFWETFLSGKSNEERVALQLQMKQELLSYVRNRLFVTSQDVNQILISFFNSPGRFSTADAFQEGIKESIRGQVQWAEAIGKFELLNTFHDQNFRGYQENDKVAKDLTFFFAGLDRNIKLLSTYPSMLVMCYHLARLKFSLKVYTWTGIFKIDAGKILEWFFNGELAPWLPYGNDQQPISKSEIALVYHYAIEMGIHTGGGVNLATLFKMLNEQMLGKLREDIAQINRAFRTQFETSAKAVEFQQICEEQKKRKASGNPVYATTRMPIVNLENYALMGFPQGGGGNLFLDETFFNAFTFYETERELTRLRLDDNMETIRLELTPKIEMLEMFRDLTRVHFERHAVENGAQELQAIDSQIQPLKDMRKDTYSRIFRIHKNTSACGEALLRGEVEVQGHAIRGLMAHFQEVHRQIAKRRATNSADKTVAPEFGFSKKYSIKGLASHERSLGYSAEGYRFSRVQALLRVADILQEGYQSNDRKFGPMRDRNSVIIPDDLQDFNQSLREKDLMIPWIEDEKAFVNFGLQLIFNHRDHVLSWADRSNRLIAFLVRIESLVAMAKAGPQETSDGIQQVSIPELLKSQLEMLKALEPDETMAYVLTATSRFTLPYLDMVLDDYAWNKGSRTWLGLFDFVYTKLSADRLGDLVSEDSQQRRGLSRAGPIMEFTGHMKAMRSLGEPAMAIPTATMSMLNGFYSRRVDTQIALLTKTIKEAKRLEALRKDKPLVFPSWRFYSNRPTPTVPLLGTSPVDQFDGTLREMAAESGYKIPADYEAAKAL